MVIHMLSVQQCKRYFVLFEDFKITMEPWAVITCFVLRAIIMGGTLQIVGHVGKKDYNQIFYTILDSLQGDTRKYWTRCDNI